MTTQPRCTVGPDVPRPPTVDVGSLESLVERRMRIVDVDGLRIGVVRIGAEAFAIHDRCPHQGAPICSGPITSRIGFEGGKVVARPGEPVLACPWHHWEFDLRSGRSLFDARYRVRTFPTELVDGRVHVRLRDD